MLRAENSGGVRSPLSVVVSGYEGGLKVEPGQMEVRIGGWISRRL